MCSAGVCEVLYNRLTDSQETEGQEETGDSVHRLTGSQETEGQVGVHDSEYFPFGDDDDNVQGKMMMTRGNMMMTRGKLNMMKDYF